jgi:hypothetical protein
MNNYYRDKLYSQKLKKCYEQALEEYAREDIILLAVLNYTRMTDSYARYLGIPTRPPLEVSRDQRMLKNLE